MGPVAILDWQCRLELDINTVPISENAPKKELIRDRVPTLFGELVGFAQEIMQKGDKYR